MYEKKYYGFKSTILSLKQAFYKEVETPKSIVHQFQTENEKLKQDIGNILKECTRAAKVKVDIVCNNTDELEYVFLIRFS